MSLAEQAAAVTDKMGRVLEGRFLLDGNLNPLVVDPQVRQGNTGGSVEAAGLQALHDGRRREPGGLDHHPATPRIQAVGAEFALEVMGVIHRDTVNELAAAEDLVPHGLQPGRPTAPVVVDRRRAVVDLEELVVPNLAHLIGRQRPAEVGMVDVGHPAHPADGIHVALEGVHRVGATLRRDDLPQVESVDMDAALSEVVGDFFPVDDQKLFPGCENAVETLDFSQKVVVRQHQEVVVALPVPAHHLVRGAVSVRVDGVGVGVPLVPLQRLTRRHGHQTEGDECEGKVDAFHGTWFRRDCAGPWPGGERKP